MMKTKFRSAFTIVELIVVISVIAILAAIVLISYGSWRTSTATNSLKSDLSNAASAMEAYRSFNNTYVTTPAQFAALPSFSPSANNTVTPTNLAAKSYCLDGSTSISDSVHYYIDDLTQKNGPTSGTCVTRILANVPGPVSNVTFSATSTQITVNWALASPNYATQYIAECALDAGYITGIVRTTVSGANLTTATMTGATATTTYFCRVRAVNSNGQSDWNNTGASNTQQYGCADLNKYGTYPDCYDYDSLPVGTSIAGYWTSPPSEYLLEDGSAVSRTTYADLFAAIGTTYGVGDGTSTFNLPDSRGRATVNISAADTEFNTIGEMYGEKSHTITVNEMPSHSHAQNVSANSGGSAVRNDWSNDNNGGVYPQGINTAGAGGGGASNVIQPSIVKQYAIKWRPSTGTASTLSAGTTLQGYWATLPVGYDAEDGDAISRTTYSDLYGVIGTTYGTGNGSTTFTLPDSRGRVGVNRNASDAEFATLGLAYGEKKHLLTVAQMATHSHTQYITANSGGSAVRNDYAADASGGVYAQGVNTGSAGGGQSFNVIQPSIVKTSTIKYSAASGSQDDSGVVPGTSIEGWWASAPAGFLLEDGSAVSRTTYANLFAVIGTTHGAGNGSTTFNLPDSRGRVSVNKNALDTQFATIGQKFGEKTHIMTLAELPSHSHAQIITALTGGSSIRTDYKADAAGGTYAQNINTNNAGSSSPYNVIQPSITKMFAIKY